jgi:hypothetical protein
MVQALKVLVVELLVVESDSPQWGGSEDTCLGHMLHPQREASFAKHVNLACPVTARGALSSLFPSL